jgi:hypothetical protein
MSEHRAAIRWTRTSQDFDYERFNREHEWDFGSGPTLREKAHTYCFIANSVKTAITVAG